MLIGKRTEDGLVPYLFFQLNDTKRESKGRHIQKRLFFWGFFLFDVANKKWKEVNRIIFLYSLFCFWITKKERETWLPYSYVPLWNRRMKNEWTVYTTRVCFPFILFSSCKRKNENGYNGSYFYFSLFVSGLDTRKRMLSYSFYTSYYEIEKRKSKGRYTHGPSNHSCFLLQFPFNVIELIVNLEAHLDYNIIIFGKKLNVN